MTTSSEPANDRIRAVLRSQPPESMPVDPMPWEQEGEFEIDAVIASQRRGELLVKVNHNGYEAHLSIVGYLPGKVTKQKWHLVCVRESGRIELIDGEPLTA